MLLRILSETREYMESPILPPQLRMVEFPLHKGISTIISYIALRRLTRTVARTQVV